jgi:hypothetical protein
MRTKAVEVDGGVRTLIVGDGGVAQIAGVDTR